MALYPGITYPEKLSYLEVAKGSFVSFRRKSESSNFNYLKIFWTPVFTGVTTFLQVHPILSRREIYHSTTAALFFVIPECLYRESRFLKKNANQGPWIPA